VVETKDFFAAMPVDSSTPEVDPNGEMQIQYKPPETPVTLAAKKSFAGRVFLSWARDPMVEVEEHPLNPNDMYTVRFYDVRYAALNGNRHPLGVTVELDKNLKVVDEYMSARGR
jgi:inner membrane protein